MVCRSKTGNPIFWENFWGYSFDVKNYDLSIMVVSRRFEHSNLSVRVAEVHQIRDFSVLDLIFHQNPPWTLNGFSDLIKEKHDYM